MNASVAAIERGEAPASSVSMATEACIPEPFAARLNEAGLCLGEFGVAPKDAAAASVSSKADLQYGHWDQLKASGMLVCCVNPS